MRHRGTEAQRQVARVLAVLLPLLGATGIAGAQYPTEPPAPMELEPLNFPPFQEFRLSNGLEIVLVESHRLPVVSISLNMRAGSRFDPRGQDGLASMVAELITKGTATRSAEQIAEEIERVGASLSAGSGADFFSLGTTVLTEHVDLAFTLVSDVLLNATYPEDELEIARRRTLSAIRLSKSQPGALTSQFFQEAIYGEHPYGRHETEESIQAITPASVRTWAAGHLKPGGALLVIAGDLRRRDAERFARRYLGSWSGTSPQATAAAPPPAQPTRILLVHRPGSAQSNIRIGNLALEPGSPTYYSGVVANKVLGEGTDARLFMILREQKGWTYGAYSNVVRRKDVGYFQTNTEVRNAVTDSALTELLHQLRRIRTEAVPDSELVAAKGYLVGSFPLSIETPQQIASQVATTKLLGLGEDYLRRYRQRLAAVTATELQRAAQAVIKTDSLVIVVVGDGQVIYDKLTPIASVRIVDVDGNALAPDELTPAVTTVAFDLSALHIGRDSLAVMVQGQELGYMVTEVSRGGGDLVYTERVAIPAAGVQGQTTLRLDPQTLEPRVLESRGSQAGQSVETHLRYERARVTGTAQEPSQGGPRTTKVDTTLAPGTMDQEATHLLTTVLPLEAGASFTLNAFDAGRGAVQPVTFKVAGLEDVTVAAGTFSAYRVDIQAGGQGFTYLVSETSPRRVLKIELAGQPVTFELVSHE
jgi:zinc protease